MKNALATAVLGAACCAAAAHAADFDGSKTLLCASVEVIECASGIECVKGTPEMMGAPQFMRVDFAKKAVVGPKRASPILHMEKSDDQILLQGTELGLGWTLAIGQEAGSLTATLASSEGTFTIFGACTPI